MQKIIDTYKYICILMLLEQVYLKNWLSTFVLQFKGVRLMKSLEMGLI